MTLGNSIKSLREQQNLSQRELAKISGVARSTLNEIENETNGGKNPRFLSLMKLCKALNITPNDLIPKEYYK